MADGQGRKKSYGQALPPKDQILKATYLVELDALLVVTNSRILVQYGLSVDGITEELQIKLNFTGQQTSDFDAVLINNSLWAISSGSS